MGVWLIAAVALAFVLVCAPMLVSGTLLSWSQRREDGWGNLIWGALIAAMMVSTVVMAIHVSP